MKSKMALRPNGTLGHCRLCHALGQLEHSHVISRLMFRPMSRQVPGTPIRFDPVGGTVKPGHLKEYMLCPICEDQFCSYEHIVGRFLARLNQLQQQPHTQHIRQSSLDYHNIKLFFLSLLWRCAVSHDPITHLVRLGTRLPTLTALLQAGDPGPENEFAIVLRVLDESQEAKNAVLTVPVPMRCAMRRGYAMVGNGVEILWITDKRGVSQEYVPYILHRDGSWLIEVLAGTCSVPWVQAVRNAHEQDRRTAREGGLKVPATRTRGSRGRWYGVYS